MLFTCCSVAGEQDSQRLCDRFQISKQARRTRIFQIEMYLLREDSVAVKLLQLLLGNCSQERFFIPKQDAGSAGNTGPQYKNLAQSIREGSNKLRHIRPRSNEAHVAAKNVVKLGQFVQFGLPEDLSKARDTRVALAGQAGIISLVDCHTSEFQEREAASALSDTVLSKQNGTGGSDADEQSDRRHQWRQYD